MQTPGTHAGGCCLHQPQVSGRQQKTPWSSCCLCCLHHKQNKCKNWRDNQGKSKIFRVRAVLWVQGGHGGDGSALDEPPWAVQLNCDHLIKCFEVKDPKLTGRSTSRLRGISSTALQAGFAEILGWVCQGRPGSIPWVTVTPLPRLLLGRRQLPASSQLIIS